MKHFLSGEFYSCLFCRDRGLSRCANEMKESARPYFHVPFSLLGEKHQHMKYHLNDLKQIVHKSRITQSGL